MVQIRRIEGRAKMPQDTMPIALAICDAFALTVNLPILNQALLANSPHPELGASRSVSGECSRLPKLTVVHFWLTSYTRRRTAGPTRAPDRPAEAHGRGRRSASG